MNARIDKDNLKLNPDAYGKLIFEQALLTGLLCENNFMFHFNDFL